MCSLSNNFMAYFEFFNLLFANQSIINMLYSVENRRASDTTNGNTKD